MAGPSGESYPPDTFLPRFEANGEISRLDLEVARRAADALAASDRTVSIAVNLSGTTVSTARPSDFARVATDRGLAQARSSTRSPKHNRWWRGRRTCSSMNWDSAATRSPEMTGGPSCQTLTDCSGTHSVF